MLIVDKIRSTIYCKSSEIVNNLIPLEYTSCPRGWGVHETKLSNTKLPQNKPGAAAFFVSPGSLQSIAGFS